jgi:hypothetical protein
LISLFLFKGEGRVTVASLKPELLTSILSSLREDRQRRKVIEKFKLVCEFEDDFATALALRCVPHGRFRLVDHVSLLYFRL